jgi:hypothetical protein
VSVTPECSTGVGRAKVAGDVDRLIEILAVDDVEAEQLFLGLGIGTVDHDRRIVLAQRGRRCRRQQARDRPEPALFRQFVLYDGKLLHDGRVLFPGPGTDGIFIVIAKDGVEHADQFPFVTRTIHYARRRQGFGNILQSNSYPGRFPIPHG